MKGNNDEHSLSEYLGPAVPRLFSETETVLDRMESKLKRGGDLHSKDIDSVRTLFHEESLDAKSLKHLVGMKTSMFFGDWNDKASMAETVLRDVSLASVRTCERVSGVLSHTSMSSAFFTSTLMYLEEYESRHGRARRPWLDQSVLFQLIGEDFERAKAAYSSANESACEAVAPIQGRIAFFARQGNDAEVARLAIERAFLAEKLREGAKPLFDTIRADFEKLRTRAAKHGYKLSFAWD